MFVLVRAHCRSPKGSLALKTNSDIIGATLCDIIHLHGFAVRLFSGFVVEILHFLFVVKKLFPTTPTAGSTPYYRARISPSNKLQLQRGAKLFQNQWEGAKYM